MDLPLAVTLPGHPPLGPYPDLKDWIADIAEQGTTCFHQMNGSGWVDACYQGWRGVPEVRLDEGERLRVGRRRLKSYGFDFARVKSPLLPPVLCSSLRSRMTMPLSSALHMS